MGGRRGTITMRVSGDSLCSTWIEVSNGPPALDVPGEGCATEWEDFLAPDRASMVFVELIGGHSTNEATLVEGIAGIGLARVELDYGTGVIAPPLVDLAPLSLRGLGFAFAVPADIEIRHISGFDREGREVLNQTR
jgi:hypothetical protein